MNNGEIPGQFMHWLVGTLWYKGHLLCMVLYLDGVLLCPGGGNLHKITYTYLALPNEISTLLVHQILIIKYTPKCNKKGISYSTSKHTQHTTKW